MEFLILANKLPYPPNDGGAIATLSMAKSLAELGHRVSLLSMNTSKHFCNPTTIPPTLKQLIEFIAVDINTDISVRSAFRNYFNTSIPYNAERFITSEYNSKLTELLLSRHFDVIQMEGLYLGPYIRTIRKLSRSLISMRAHNVEHEIWQRTAAVAGGIKGLYLANLAKRIKRFETSMINNYDTLIPITGRDAGVFRKLGCNIPIHVAPTGVNTHNLEPDPDQAEFPSLFHIGALDWAPNQEGLRWFFNKVWHKVHKMCPNLKFYLAGRNAPRWFREINEPNVVFMGEVPDAHVFIRSKAIMIVPLFSGSGLRIKIIEGMALGKAIVTTTIGTEGISSTYGENIMIADDPERFAQAIFQLVESEQLTRKLGSNAARFVRQYYDNSAITRSLVDFYSANLF